MRNIFDIEDNLHVKDDIPSVLKWGVVRQLKVVVSIVMPVYNHPQYFKSALESAINQDFSEPYEIIVVDNNMEDDINYENEFERFVKKKNDGRVLYYKNVHNIGGTNNFNRGPQLIHSNYFVYLHDDDELCPDCLSTLFRVKEKYHTTDELIVLSQLPINNESKIYHIISKTNKHKIFKIIKNKLTDVSRSSYKLSLYDWFLRSYTNGGGCLHSKNAFVSLGGYNPEYSPSGDYALYIAYSHFYGSIYIPNHYYKYRIAENDAEKVYLQTLERNDFYRLCMMDKLLEANSKTK